MPTNDSSYLNRDYNNNNNQNLEKLILALTSFIDATTQEYFSFLQHHYNQSSPTSSSSSSSYNSNQQNSLVNFSNKTQYNEFQTSSIYLTPSTSSSSLPQSKSTSPYLLHHTIQQQQQQQQQQQNQQISTNVNYIQDLMSKLRQKVLNKLDDYLSDIKSINNDHELSKFNNNPEKENFISYSPPKENSSSVDSLVVAFLVLIISDQANQLKLENDTDETMSHQKSLASYFDLEFNLITNKINKVLVGNLKSIFDRIYRNANEDSNRVIKMLHFILILLMQNYYSPTAAKTMTNKRVNNNYDYNNFFTESTTTITNVAGYYEEVEENGDDDDEDINENEDEENVNYVNNKNFKLLKIISGLIGLKCQNKLTKNRILLNLETFV